MGHITSITYFTFPTCGSATSLSMRLREEGRTSSPSFATWSDTTTHFPTCGSESHNHFHSSRLPGRSLATTLSTGEGANIQPLLNDLPHCLAISIVHGRGGANIYPLLNDMSHTQHLYNQQSSCPAGRMPFTTHEFVSTSTCIHSSRLMGRCSVFALRGEPCCICVTWTTAWLPPPPGAPPGWVLVGLVASSLVGPFWFPWVGALWTLGSVGLPLVCVGGCVRLARRLSLRYCLT